MPTHTERRVVAAAEALHTLLEQKLGPGLVTVGYGAEPPVLVVYTKLHKHLSLVPGRFKNIKVESRVVGHIRPCVRPE
jgi:hypothetical protein